MEETVRLMLNKISIIAATNHQVWFNKTPLKYGEEFRQPDLEDFPELNFKNAHVNHVLENTTDYIRTVIKNIKLVGGRAHTIVDIKVHDIEPGKHPCLPGWHCDSVIDPSHPTEGEIHHIFVTGQASLTEFIGEPICLCIDSRLQQQQLLNSFRNQICNINPRIIRIPSCTITTYGRLDFHRGSTGLFNEKRLLIRVTETDLIRPTNRTTEFKLYN